ncbi:TPA: hypothetical protein QH023_003742 [Morganella morganii subsp. morganii]|nr:hypothetical protein [Morganella morganii subsp. morganii]HDU8581334.1 hypothetical protein [Morganella morganii]
MKYSVDNVKMNASTEEITAIKLAIAVMAWTRGEIDGNNIVATLRSINLPEVKKLADEIDQLNPAKAKL